uniref:Transposase n=1 Tax=Meloidogyne javanica TaxID=6303 RepID=A0A915LNC9_MELJA
MNDNDFLQWLAEKKLIWTTRNCECGKQMVKLNQKKVHGPFGDAIKDRTMVVKCPQKQVIEFTYYSCRDTHTQAEFQFDMGLSTHAIVDWKMFCRDVAASYFLNHPEKIGGISKTVEIDETVLCKPKYSKGREVAK